jgi:prepilin-type N-terminal cleavage/methylation domain-containing protein
MKPGFSLLEIVIAIAIGAIVSVLLYQATSQTARVVKTIDVLIDVHSELALFIDRVTKDVSGAFVPRIAIDEKEAPPEKKPEKKPEEKKPPSPEKKKETEHNVFVVQNMTLDEKAPRGSSLFTFISTSPLSVYGEFVPRRVRIAYVIESQKDSKGLYKLVRYESTEIDLKKFEEKQRSNVIKGYSIVRNIKSLRVECYAAQEEAEQESQEKDKDKAKYKEAKPIREYERFTSWKSSERKKNKQSFLPEWVVLKGALVDARQKRELSYEVLIPIPAWNSVLKPVQLQSSYDRLEEILKKAGLSLTDAKQEGKPQQGSQ